MQLLIPSEVKEVMNKINDSGFEAYLVGGCVRDSLLDIKPKDYDITTNAKLDELKTIFINYHQIHNSGEKHNTLTIMINKEIIEITSFKSDKKNPTIVDDLACRDLTINAMAYNEKEGLIDPFNGREDLQNKVIKANNPSARFEEDYLRILRALRFSSKLGYEIEKTTNQAIFKLKDDLNYIAKERINVELKGILIGKDVRRILTDYQDVIAKVMPEIKPMFNFNQNNPYHMYDVYMHSVYTVSYTKPDFVTRMAALLHDVGKPITYSEEVKDNEIVGHFYGHAVEGVKIANGLLHHLRYPNKEIEEICYLIRYHDLMIVPTKKFIKKVLTRTPNRDLSLFKKLLDLQQADINAHLIKKHIDFKLIEKIAEEIIAEEACLSIKDLNINGYDLLDLGFEGVIIGDILDTLLDMVISEEILNVKDDLIEYVKKNYFK